MSDIFRKIASKISYLSGTAWAFLLALGIIVVWAVTGPIFGFSTTWQLVINTGTTIVTFLMVFLIQNTQNRDSKAIHIKLDELLKAGKGARNSLVNLEELPDEVLDELEDQFRKMQTKYSKQLETTKIKSPIHQTSVVNFFEAMISIIKKI